MCIEFAQNSERKVPNFFFYAQTGPWLQLLLSILYGAVISEKKSVSKEAMIQIYLRKALKQLNFLSREINKSFLELKLDHNDSCLENLAILLQ